MAYKIKKNLANSKNYGGKRTKKVEWIVIHYTANDGDHDESNANYFHNNSVGASAHYFVDGDSITQSVPEDYVAWSVGGKYNVSGNAGKYYGKCTNENSISIELCDETKDGKIYPSDATIKNALAFTKDLMSKYGIKADHVIRHYDVNGKQCPAYWVDDSKWKKEFHNKLSKTSTVVDEKETKTEYYAKCDKKYDSLVSALNSLKIVSTYEHRKKIAKANDISNYSGTATQNGKMLTLLKNGKLIKV